MNPSKLILVEGPDDEYAVRAILDAHQIPCEIQNRFRRDNAMTDNTIIVEQTGGVTKLRRNLYGILGSATLKYVGIIVDADANIAERWQSISNTLKEFGAVQMPLTPDPTGTVVETIQPEGTIRVGVWLMPDNQIPGALETFIEFLVPSPNPLWERAKRNVDEIPAQERLFGNKHLQKVYLHTWLAWQKDPGSTLGQAINNRYLDAQATHAQTFVAWVRRVFDV